MTQEWQRYLEEYKRKNKWNIIYEYLKPILKKDCTKKIMEMVYKKEEEEMMERFEKGEERRLKKYIEGYKVMFRDEEEKEMMEKAGRDPDDLPIIIYFSVSLIEEYQEDMINIDIYIEDKKRYTKLKNEIIKRRDKRINKGCKYIGGKIYNSYKTKKGVIKIYKGVCGEKKWIKNGKDI